MGGEFDSLNCLNCKEVLLKNVLDTKKENNKNFNEDETLKDEFCKCIKDFKVVNTKKQKANSIKNIKISSSKKRNTYYLDQPDFFNLLSDIEEFSSKDEEKLKIEKVTNLAIDNKRAEDNCKFSDKNCNYIDRYNDSSVFVSINKNFGDSIDTTKINNLYSDYNEIKDVDNEQLNSITKNLVSTSKSSKFSKSNVLDVDISNKLANIRKNHKYYFKCLEEYFLDKPSNKNHISTKKGVNNSSTDFKTVYTRKKMNDTFSGNTTTSNISKGNNRTCFKYYQDKKNALNDDEEKNNPNNNKLLWSTDNRTKEKKNFCVNFNKTAYLNNKVYSNYRKINFKNKTNKKY